MALLLQRVSWFSNALMILTSVHHIYGAIIYHTPWRLHVLLLSIPVLVLTIILSRAFQQKKIQPKGWVFCAYWILIFLPSIVLIGFFKGLYNHTVKNVLFYANVDQELLLQLFPTPTYEMPNDFWFECSGVLQSVLLIPLTVYFIRMMKAYFEAKTTKMASQI